MPDLAFTTRIPLAVMIATEIKRVPMVRREEDVDGDGIISYRGLKSQVDRVVEIVSEGK